MLGKWISCAECIETPMFRRTFEIKKIGKAKIKISGLGYFTLLINGRRVTEDLFTPAQTDYRDRDHTKFSFPIYDKLSHRVYYLEYDVSSFLSEGKNTLDIIVGNGWYRQALRDGETRGQVFGNSLLAWYELSIDDADSTRIIYSDGSEECYIYPIYRSNMYFGEKVDTRKLQYPDKSKTLISDFVPERFEKQICPSDKIIRTIIPKLLKREGNKAIYDAGENISGYVAFKAKGKSGAEIGLRFAESVLCCELYTHSTGDFLGSATGEKQIQSDTFVLNGEDQELEPMFVFHGFRYFEAAYGDDVEYFEPVVKVIHTDINITSSFESSNEMLNFLYDAFIRSYLGNMHGCVPSDCPTRERLGYTGDGQIVAPSGMLLADTDGVYRKWITDILDCQCKKSGHVQHTAPFEGGGGGPGGWGCAIVTVPYNHYLRFGDIAVLEEAFSGMVHWLEYMIAHSKNGLLVSEEDKGWCLGDWSSRNAIKIPADYVNTCYMIYSFETVTEIAKLLGKELKHDFHALADESRKALMDKYYSGDSYCQGVQGADAYAFWVKLPNYRKCIKSLKARYENNPELDMGFIGMDIFGEVLTDIGEKELLMKLISDPSQNSFFGLMRSEGATTLYESSHSVYDIDNRPEYCSLNHPMFGAIVRQLFHGFLGIRQRKGTAGYKDIIISPLISDIASEAKGSIMVQNGRISVALKRIGGTKNPEAARITVEIPTGIKAVLCIGEKEYKLNEGQISSIVV